jgi:hypothetical protein
MKFLERYHLILKPSSDTNLCEPHDHISRNNNKIDNEFWKVKINLIEMWLNENMFQDTKTIEIRTPSLQIQIYEQDV